MSDAGLVNAGQGYRGFQDEDTASSQFNAMSFLVQRIMARISTSTVVKVMGVDGGFVDIMPLVNQIDGNGNAFPHGTIYRCPFWRLQGGNSGIVCDPVVGDIGYALFADRDISSVVANRGQANPGSRRRFDMADAVYLGGILDDEPTQFVRLAPDGITISSPVAIELDAPTISLVAPAVTIMATGAVTIVSATLTHNGKNIGDTHEHSGVTAGGGHTGPPL